MAAVLLLDHRDPGVAGRIHAVLRLAHAQEARWLGGAPARPLDRTPQDIAASDELFLGCVAGGPAGGALLAALALGADARGDRIRITLLVVDPAQLRRGLARALVGDAIRRAAGLALGVVAVAANAPALALYRSLGFVVVRHGSLGDDALPVLELRRPPDPAPAAP